MKVTRTMRRKTIPFTLLPRKKCPAPGTAQASRQAIEILTGSTPGCRAIGSSLRLFLDHPNLQLARHLEMQPDRHRVDAQALDRILEENLPLVYRIAFLLQCFRYVAVGDRSVQCVA